MNDNKNNQYTQNYMIEFAQAKQLVITHTPQIKAEIILAEDSLNRVLAQPIISPVAIPPFNNSAMDGYAVNASDLDSASETNPISLNLIGITAAGDFSKEVLNTQGKAWKIMTGAPVPKGFDSVIPVENTSLNNSTVRCISAPELGAHIRMLGEDFVKGDTIATPGRILNTNMISAFAALGIGELSVFEKINIAVFSTGKELVDNATQKLKPGQIRNSNKAFILNWFNGLPVNAFDAGTNFDDIEKFENDLQNQIDQNTHIIISSGAVSMGDFDFIPQTIKKLGGEIIFHKSKIRPGKPILFAKFPNGSLYFGLPGNPISAAIGLRFFVSTAILRLLALNEEKPLAAISSNGLTKKQGFRSILKANASINSEAKFEVTILEGQESFKIQPLLKANGWAVIDETKNNFSRGDLIEFYPSDLNWEN
jgi:molybdopterin molybdotransferase